TVQYTVANQGGSPTTTGRFDEIWASVDNVVGNADDFRVTYGLNVSVANNAIAAGATRDYSITFRPPSHVPASIRWQVRLDTGNQVAEGTAGEANNRTNGDAVVVRPCNLELTVADPGTITPGGSITVSYTYRNIGAGTCFPTIPSLMNLEVRTYVYLSTDGALDGSDRLIYNYFSDQSLLANAGGSQTGLSPGESVTRTQAGVGIPSNLPVGNYRVLVAFDRFDNVSTSGYDAIYEYPGEDNEIWLSPDPFAPDMIVDALVVPPAIQIGQSIPVSWTVRNGGVNAAQGQWFDEVLLSDDQTIGNDIPLGSFARSGPLASGSTYTSNQQITVPVAAGTGTYFFLVRTDAANTVDEYSESNNVRRSDTTSTSTGGDLVVITASAPSAIVLGESTAVSWTVRNIGTASVDGWTDIIYLSTDATLDASDTVLSARPNASALAPNSQYATSTQVALPLDSGSGQRYLFVFTDATNTLLELNDTNNISTALPATVTEPPLPDLVASGLVVPSSVSIGQPITLAWQTANTGELPASGWIERVRLIAPGGAIAAQLALFTQSGSMAAGASAQRSVSATIPAQPGTYTVVVDVDTENTIAEASGEANNRFTAGSIEVLASDLVAQNATFPTTSPKGEQITVSWTASNIGAGAAYGSWNSIVSLSADATYDATDANLGTVTYSSGSGPIAAGAGVARSLTATVPASLADGTYYVLVRTDTAGQIAESNETNNTLVAGTISVTAQLFANLVVQSVTVAPSGTLGGQISISWTVANTGNRTTGVGFYDRVWYSTDAVFGSDVVGGSFSASQVLVPGATATQTRNVNLPPTAGTYFVFIETDHTNGIGEGADEGDNVSLAAGPVQVGAADLVLSNLVVAEQVSAGAPIAISWTTTNQGTFPTVSSWFDRARFVDAPGGNQVSLVGDVATNAPLAAGASIPKGVTGTVPNALGIAFMEVRADINNTVVEGPGESNNVVTSAAVTIIGADLRAELPTVPASIEQFVPATIAWTTRNAGPGDSYGGCWTDRIYLSANTTYEASDFAVGFVSQCGSPFAAGAVKPTTKQITVTDAVPAGVYNVLVRVDADGVRFESNVRTTCLSRAASRLSRRRHRTLWCRHYWCQFRRQSAATTT
ncbi:MAG: CARDB domain-containing protein, partial [bacterium]